MDKLMAADIAVDAYLRISREVSAINSFLVDNGIEHPAELMNQVITEKEKESVYLDLEMSGWSNLNMAKSLKEDKTPSNPDARSRDTGKYVMKEWQFRTKSIVDQVAEEHLNARK